MKTRILHTYDAECDKCKGVCTHDASKSQPAKRTRKVGSEEWFKEQEVLKQKYQPKTGQSCGCRKGVQRDNCPACEGTGMMIDFKAIRDAKPQPTKQSDDGATRLHLEGLCELFTERMKDHFTDEALRYFITAVNSHEELLEELKGAVGFIKVYGAGLEKYQPGLIARWKEAIAKAEGK